MAKAMNIQWNAMCNCACACSNRIQQEVQKLIILEPKVSNYFNHLFRGNRFKHICNFFLFWFFLNTKFCSLYEIQKFLIIRQSLPWRPIQPWFLLPPLQSLLFWLFLNTRFCFPFGRPEGALKSTLSLLERVNMIWNHFSINWEIAVWEKLSYLCCRFWWRTYRPRCPQMKSDLW